MVLPLFHANAQYYSFASAIWAGASLALMPAFTASGFLAQAARHQATCASLFAAPMRMILVRGAPVEGLALRHCWYAQNIADDQYDTLADWLGCRPRQLYGMTETIPAVLTEPADNPVPSSMGQVTPGCEVMVRDGEVLVGGEPGITLFAGYLDDPDTTAASFTADGWFRTGDRARIDPDGRHYFDGRHSDVLKVAGENVSIVEVESVLASHTRGAGSRGGGRTRFRCATRCRWPSWSPPTRPALRRAMNCRRGAKSGWLKPRCPARLR